MKQPTPVWPLVAVCVFVAVLGGGGVYAMTLVDRSQAALRASATVVVVIPPTRTGTAHLPGTTGAGCCAPAATFTPAPTLTASHSPARTFVVFTTRQALEPTETPITPTRRATSSPTATPTVPSPTPTPTATASPTPLIIPYPDGLTDAYLPRVSDRARAIYRYGISHGNDPRVFSRLGDCHSSHPGFLGAFDTPTAYRLGDYAYLRDAVDHFSGSFSRPSQTGYSGLHMGSFFSPLWADPQVCNGAENVMECEYRLRRPSIIFVNIGTLNMASPDEQYESFLRRIVEFWLGKSVLPILNTKADNLEGGDRFNNITRRIAAEYDLPLWDFWIAAQTLPDQGLQGDRVHLSDGGSFFDDPGQMHSGWTMRNLTGLQALDAVWRKVR